MRPFNKTIAVKTHYMNRKSLDLFDRLILLIRNPYNNILAFFNFKQGGRNHVGYARNELFLKGGKLNSITNAVDSSKLPAFDNVQNKNGRPKERLQ